MSQGKKQRRLGAIEKLQSRKLMAADLGFAPHFFAEATSSAAEVTVERENGVVTITGTNLNDEVTVTERTDGKILIIADTVDQTGAVNRVVAGYPVNGVTRIEFEGLGGHDYFRNDTSKVSFANGGSGDDELIGGEAFDRLDGGYGDDTLRGGGYIDYLIGGFGDDAMYGGDGNDSMQGDAGNDTMRGERGADYMYGGTGDDRLFGDSGSASYSDRLYGGDGDDLLAGGGGHDQLYGQNGIDSLHGNDGHDQLFGGGDVDYLYGGRGNDWLDGGNDRVVDHLYGGQDNDTFVRHRNVVWSSVHDVNHDYGVGQDDIEDDWHW